jgi:septal ring-binding cell division protein DamX
VVAALALITFIIFAMVANRTDLADISFYDSDFDPSQLALEEDFTSRQRRDDSPPPLRLEAAKEAPETAAGGGEEGRVSESGQPRDETGAEEQRQTTGPASYADFDAAQAEALRIGHEGRWAEAAGIWNSVISVDSESRFTLIIQRSGSETQISGAFEEFANSSRLRNRFFVIRSEDRFHVCWGLFPDAAAARRALDTLPAKIKALGPVPVDLSSILNPR